MSDWLTNERTDERTNELTDIVHLKWRWQFTVNGVTLMHNQHTHKYVGNVVDDVRLVWWTADGKVKRRKVSWQSKQQKQRWLLFFISQFSFLLTDLYCLKDSVLLLVCWGFSFVSFSYWQKGNWFLSQIYTRSSAIAGSKQRVSLTLLRWQCFVISFKWNWYLLDFIGIVFVLSSGLVRWLNFN